MRSLLSSMTLEEKVGQMTQPEITSITPEEVAQFHIGSVLNGGGAWPQGNKYASLADWLSLADAYWDASLRSPVDTPIPVMWGIDAVHGNNNIYGATVFPHNIGLGAAADPALVREIGKATAAQIRASGQDWAFAPTVAVVKDDRWGRTYEGFSEDPRIVHAYGYEAVMGLQGDAADGIGPEGVIATAKHYLGDGGTLHGTDQGINDASEDVMINVHAQGYYTAIAAGAQTVMASFNSWTNEELGIAEGKLHGSSYVLTEVLKEKIGFDGLVVSDWNGQGQVPGCTNTHCAQAINAGLDVIMVPQDWREFIAETIDLVKSGEIPMSRIDDAVSRILRVKIRSGIMTQPRPSERLYAGDAAVLEWRELGRRAVRESLVLLKNNENILPLPGTLKVLVVGKSADNMANQTGGWTLTWQGTENANSDFPNATTVLAGLQEAFGASNVTFSEDADGVDASDYDAVIAVIGETPYAEGVGDIGRRSLEAARLFPEDLAVLDRVSGAGTPVVTVLLTGRPLFINKELNRSDALVVGWLPGTEGAGIADLLVHGPRTGEGFVGTLSFSWPKTGCDKPLNLGDEGYDPLFAFGYGLRNGDTVTVPQLDESAEDRCHPAPPPGDTVTEELMFFDRRDVDPYKAFIASPTSWAGTPIGNDVNAVVTHPNITVRTSDINVQLDARKVTWTGEGAGQFLISNPTGGVDVTGYLAADAALVFDTIVTKAPSARVVIGARSIYPNLTQLDATSLFTDLAGAGRSTVKIPLSCFAADERVDFSNMDTPLVIHTDGTFEAAFSNIRWMPGAAHDDDARSCDTIS